MNHLNATSKVMRLGELAQINLGISSSRTQNDLIDRDGDQLNSNRLPLENEVRLIQVRDIVEYPHLTERPRPFEGKLLPLNELQDSAPKVPEIRWEKFMVQEGDVLLSSKGSVLKSALVEHQSAGAVATSNLIILRPNRHLILPRILLGVLRLPRIEAALMKLSRSSVKAVALSTKDLAAVKIPVPAMEFQPGLAETLQAEEEYLQASMMAVEAKTRLVWELFERSVFANGMADD